MITTLRSRLIVIFVVATALPLAATLWIATSLVDQSLGYSSSASLDAMSKSLRSVGREYLQSEREALKSAVAVGRVPERFVPVGALNEEEQQFWQSREPERFLRSGSRGDRLDLIQRRVGGVAVYSRHLDVNLSALSEQYHAARQQVDRSRSRDLRRGFMTTLIVLTGAVWLVSLVLLTYLARRVSRPIRALTAGLSELADGNLAARLEPAQDDEIGLATLAFNRTAAQLEQSRDRLVYLTQLASWQVLARKTAHEVKNSLTPIRLTVEEMVARHAAGSVESQQAFLEQAAQIVVDEIESLERRVRAFSEFSTEPPVLPELLDINAVVEERIAFLRTSHPEIEYAVRLAEKTPCAVADEDLVKSILVNLLENAAEAAGTGGRVLAKTELRDDRVEIEVHDSGPGLSELARKSLFQPTISFKKRGMGLGLSIARKSALANGGDICVVAGELGGAAFRVILPTAFNHESEANSRR